MPRTATNNQRGTCRKQSAKAVEAPQDLEAERGLLGGILLDSSTLLAAGDMKPTQFYLSQHQTIYRAMLQMAEAGDNAFDPVTVGDFLKRRDELTEVGGYQYLNELLESVVHAGHTAHYATAIKERSLDREMQARVADAARVVGDLTLSTSERLEYLDGLTAHLRQSQSGLNCESFANLDGRESKVDWLIDDMLVAGQHGGIFGSKKSLKTNASIDLVLSGSIGGRFLGQFQFTRPVRSALLSGESGMPTIQETARRIAISKGRTLREFFDAFIGFELPNIGDAGQLRSLERFVTDHHLGLLIVDPIYLCMPIGDSAGNMFASGPMLKGLSDIGQKTGCTMLVNHHTKRGVADPFAPPELEDIAWSGFQEWARQWLLVGRRQKYDPDRGGSHRLWLNIGGSAGHSGLWAVDIEEGTPRDPSGRKWDVSLSTASEARSEAAESIAERREAERQDKQDKQAARDRERLLEAADTFPEGETKSRLKDAAGLPTARFNIALATLLQSGEFEACEITKNSRTESAYKRGRERSGTVGKPGLF
jgi:hypothetical protein